MYNWQSPVTNFNAPTPPPTFNSDYCVVHLKYRVSYFPSCTWLKWICVLIFVFDEIRLRFIALFRILCKSDGFDIKIKEPIYEILILKKNMLHISMAGNLAFMIQLWCLTNIYCICTWNLWGDITMRESDAVRIPHGILLLRMEMNSISIEVAADNRTFTKSKGTNDLCNTSLKCEYKYVRLSTFTCFYGWNYGNSVNAQESTFHIS